MISKKKLRTPVRSLEKSSSVNSGSLAGTAIAMIEAVSTPVLLFKIVLATQFYMNE